MIKNSIPPLRPVMAAAVAGSFLMLVFGLTYRVLAARLAAPADVAPIAPAALEQFPRQMGDWNGEDVPIDEATVRATDTDAHLNRRYGRHGGLESVMFYVACGVKVRDLMPHRPEVCYVGAGWTSVGRHSLELPLNDGRKLPCNVLQFARGAFSTQKIAVLDYYLVDGEYCRDVSLLRSKAWHGSGAVRYVAQVQIATPVTATLNADAAVRIVSDFAVESALSTARLFENPEKPQGSDEFHKAIKEE